MFRLFYTLVLFILFIAYLPRFFYNRLRYGKYKGHLLARLGMGDYSFKTSGKRSLWIHAISLGETKAVLPLVKRMREEFPDQEIYFSTTTETGLNEAKKNLGEFVSAIFLLPFDLFVRPLVRLIHPSLLILTEGDLWFNLIDEVKLEGGEVILVNGKISERSQKLFQKSGLFNSVADKVDLFLVQNDSYKERFLKLGVPEDKVSVTGNLKWDMAPKPVSEEEKASIISRFNLNASKVITFGSTHAGEELLAIRVSKELIQNGISLKLFLVPRHPERVAEVAELLRASGLTYSLFSEPNPSRSASIILVDKMGVLNLCYAISDLCCVAGSWTERVGGHNILEPLWFQKLVVFGPYMFSQLELEKAVLDAGAAIQVDANQLSQKLLDICQNEVAYSQLGRLGKKLVDNSKGSLDATWSRIQPLISFSDCAN